MKEVFRNIINILNFRNLSINQKILFFSLGSLFWLLLISSISLLTIFKMSLMSEQMVEEIVPQEKATNSVIRKLRGANISVHKIIIYNDQDSINANYSRAKERLQDCKNFLNALLNGGTVVDYSIITDLLIDRFSVYPLQNVNSRKLVEDVISRIEHLDNILDEIKSERLNKNNLNSLLEKVSYYDVTTSESIKILNQNLLNILNEWRIFEEKMYEKFNFSVLIISSVFLITALLSGAFGFLISQSLRKSVTEITDQFKKLHSGDIDLTKKLTVYSKDELGQLTTEFNKFMDALSGLSSFKKIIEEDDTIDDVYMRLARIFSEELKFDSFIIYEVSNSTNTMKVIFPKEAEGLQLYCSRDILLDCQLCRVNRTAHLISSAAYPNICKYFIEDKDVIHFCLPIITEGNVGGVVQFICAKREECDLEEFEKKIKKAMRYIQEAQPVIEAKRLMKALKESSFKDALTGLYNRRFLEESFENIVAGILRRGTILGLLMCDIDFFKQINDVYGHDTGDVVLKEIGNNIKNSVRASDLVIRFGGEEFLVLLIDSKEGNSIEIAEKIRKRIEDIKIKITGGFIQKTISIGVSEFPVDTQNFWEAIKFADVALYKAKEMGRNRVIRFTQDMWTEENY